MKTVAFILCEVVALEQSAGVTLSETCKTPTNKEPQDVAYADLWTPGLLIHAPSGCARPRKRCGDGYQPSGVPQTPIPHVMLSGRGKWYWVGPNCNAAPLGRESFLNPIYEGHTFHLVDEDIVVAERTVQKDELFIQALPCHKKTMDINCAHDFVGKTPSIGMHVLCFLKNRVCAYRDGSGVCELLESEDLTTVEHIAHAMGLPPRQEGLNPMRFYTLDGKWVATVHGHFALLLFENGAWFWPPMEMNYSRKVSLTDRDVRVVTRSITPAIFEVMDPMIDNNEIDRILELTATRLAPSTVGYQSDKTEDTKIRTSTGTFLHPHLLDDLLFKFYVRAQSLIRIPLTQTEHLQVVKYEPSQFYVAHSDVVEDKDGGKQKRMATLFTNFKDVEKGGATGFPYARTPPNVNNPECAILEMPAYKGKSIFWYNTYPNGAISSAADHMGCKVEIGEKLASNFWFWDGFSANKKDENLWMHDDRSVKASRPHFNDADIAFFAKWN